MLLFSSLLGVLLSLILLWFNSRRNTSSVYLGVFFLLISLYELYQYTLIYSKSVLLVKIILFLFPLITPPLYLIGPAIYWYTRSILTDNFRLKRRDMWHLLPLVVYFIASLKFTFVPFHEKAEIAEEVVKDAAFLQTYKTTYLSGFIPASVMYMSRTFLVLIYTLWSVILVLKYTYSKKLSGVFAQQRFMRNWLLLLLVSLLVLVVTQTLLIRKVFDMNFSSPAFALNIIRIISISFLFIVLISPFLFPSILYGLPRIPIQANAAGPAENKAIVEGKQEKSTASHLEEHYLRTIENKISACMQEQELYLQPAFNINQLSVQTGIPFHHLGYYFREFKRQSFTEYKNRWRIEHAKKLIEGGKINELTLEAIAELSGFSNRNSFRTTFEKVEGVAPSIYASRVKEADLKI